MGESKKRHPVLDGIEMGVGTMAWGDQVVWGYGRGSYTDDDIKAAFRASLQAGITLLDTAEVYGLGRSELIIGQLIQAISEPVKIATKFMPYPWRLGKGSLRNALRASLRRLNLKQVDLYQIHWPFPPVKIETWMQALIEVIQAGMVKTVGVSNYDRRQMQRGFDALAKEGVALASNQVEYHLLNREIEKNGLLQHCSDLGITVIAYSPLDRGLLTGKYHAEDGQTSPRRFHYSRSYLQQIQPLINTLTKIGNDHAGKTAGQVALNWLICKGALPIPGAKNQVQAELNSGALGWRLTEEDVAKLDEISDQVTKSAEGRNFSRTSA